GWWHHPPELLYATNPTHLAVSEGTRSEKVEAFGLRQTELMKLSTDQPSAPGVGDRRLIQPILSGDVDAVVGASSRADLTQCLYV
ncbi:hypothetical protein INR49_014627, partial [Caranx melampygus]